MPFGISLCKDSYKRAKYKACFSILKRVQYILSKDSYKRAKYKACFSILFGNNSL